MTKVMHVEGKLKPSNPEAVNENTYDRMDTEIVRNALVVVLRNPANWDDREWKKGKIIADSRTETPGGRPAAMDFITRLCSFVTAPGIAQLGLEGDFMVTVDGVREPVVFKVTVKNGKVKYKEANLVWNSEEIFNA